ncbi:MAG: hypothetical protein KGD63_00245 [Candidatus Lokiarchaeota archaeon]|nr:hypothetical protein [Candidatus Lokiarchaeota archaeon]
MYAQKQFDGWLLDVSTYDNGVILWVKYKGNIIKIHDDFLPEFYAVPNKGVDNNFERLKYILEGHPYIETAKLCEKYVNLEDNEKSKVFEISVVKPSFFKKTIKEINRINLFTLYNTDLPIAQMYFYVNNLFPVSYCSFKVKIKKNNKNKKELIELVSLELKDNNEELFYNLPPLKAIWLSVKIRHKDIHPYYNDILEYIEVSLIDNDENNIPRADGHKGKKILIDEGDEAETLKKVSEIVEKINPDIILTQKGDEFIFPYLAARASINQVSNDVYFSRDKTPLKNCIFNLSSNSDHYMSYGIIFRRSNTQVYFNGRFHLDTTSYASLHFSDGNIPGLIEVARISRVPIQRLCRITIGGALQSIQFYNSYELDHLIPPFKKNPESFKNSIELLYSDRGGHIFEPKIGVFDQVVELDFSSMYPSLMATYNISSETINCKCCKNDGTSIKVPGLNFHICTKRQGIISKSIRLPLEKRLKYKEYNKVHDDIRYEFIDKALKWVLVVSFGYLGFKNARFGKIEAHQTVCAFAREFLLRAAEIAQKHGCQIIHGIVDSIWLKDRKNRSPEEFEIITKKIADEITDHTNIPMNWEGRYNIIVFLPSRAEANVPALSHYWGIKSNGESKVRGIEVRRRDIPMIIKNAQYAFIDVFQSITSINDFMESIPKAKKILYEYANRILSGNVSKNELSIKQKISRKPSEYKVNSYQAVASKQLERSGVIASAGKNVNYIILNAEADSDFPEKKVILSDLYNEKNHQYDKKKYIELLKRAFENIFPFKFPELEELLNLNYNQKFIQRNLREYVDK